MGIPCDDLVPAALLWMHPGVKKEEFARLLDQIRLFCYLDEPENSQDYESSTSPLLPYHYGLYGLAKILGLDETESSKEFKKGGKDDNGLLIKAPTLDIKIKGNYYGKDGGHDFVVNEHIKNNIELERKITIYSEKEAQEGKILNYDKVTGKPFGYPECISEKGIVRKRYSKTKVSILEIYPELASWPEGKETIFKYVADMERIIPVVKKESFKSEEELWNRWPEFHPENIYDWTKEKGEFYNRSFHEKISEFYWVKKGDRYYLDDKTFNLIPECYNRMWGYTNFVMTAEAIKHNYWKVLSYAGFVDYFDEFLKKYPGAREANERAVWDAYTSRYARDNKLTNIEFLRRRILFHRE